MWLDLLVPDQEDRYARRPQELVDQLATMSPAPDWVVIDEVQRVPKLLSVVHHLIETRRQRFALTGSSARKIKRGGADLLAGRALVRNLFPFTSVELGSGFHLQSALTHGSLPGLQEIDSNDDRAAFLRAYALTYLKEEIWAEQAVRKLDPFRAFLEVAAQCNSELINYTRIARDVSVDTKTVQSYFAILADTLLGFLLEPYHASVRKRQTQAPKFYFFDPGVKRALDRTLTVEVRPHTFAYGKSFEHWVVIEAVRRSAYLDNDFRFSYLRTKDGAEIDLVVERPGAPTALIEIKSTESVSRDDVRMLERFRADMRHTHAYCLSLDPIAKRLGNVEALPWSKGLDAIGLDLASLLC